MRKGLSNAEQPSLSDIMSDPEYLGNSLARHKLQQQLNQAAKQAMGFKNPRRELESVDYTGFAEGALSADEADSPRMAVNKNPRFSR